MPESNVTNGSNASLSGYDTLFVHGLRVETIIGVFAWEREVQQELRFDIDLHIDMQASAKSDELDDAISYVDVADAVTHITQNRAAKLLEFLAEEISTELFARWPIHQLTLRITKPTAVAAADGVGVAITRTRS